MNNPVLAALLIASLSGCATPTRESLMEAWMGHSESELVSNLGEPTAAVRNREGMKILTWKDEACSQSFMLDNTGEVVQWSHRCSNS